MMTSDAAVMPEECPKCGSPKPHLHPAVQFEGEVQICTDPFHSIPTNQNPPRYLSRPAPPPEGTVERIVEIICECVHSDYALTGVEAAAQRIAALAPVLPEGWAAVPEEIINEFPEINPNNYDYDDVCALNAWGVSVVLSASPPPGSAGRVFVGVDPAREGGDMSCEVTGRMTADGFQVESMKLTEPGSAGGKGGDVAWAVEIMHRRRLVGDGNWMEQAARAILSSPRRAVDAEEIKLGPDGREWTVHVSASAHVSTMVSRADANRGTAPLWHGWALHDSFVAGAEWQESRFLPPVSAPAMAVDAETVRRGVYVASRASTPERPAMWRRLRDQGHPIISTWIDEAGEGDTENLGELWKRIEREVKSAIGLVLYVEAGDFPLKGAYIEVGIALAAGIPVTVVCPGVALDPRSMRPLGSWAKHPLVWFCDDVEAALHNTAAIAARAGEGEE